MTIPLFPEAQQRPRGKGLLVARIASTLALGISLIPPRTIARILTLLSNGTVPATQKQALEARLAACAVSVRSAGNGCLQRSIAVFLLCRMSGTTPDWCTGFLNRPFLAHAWVEVDGEPVGETAEIADYTTILAIRPHS